jgi:integrase/recombinase XerD
METLKTWIAGQYSKNSVKNYLQLIDRYRTFTNVPEAATYQDVIDYVAYLRSLNKHPKTLRNHLFAIKMYYRYLVETGQRTHHPCQHLQLKDRINRAVDVQSLYPIKTLETFLNECSDKTPPKKTGQAQEIRQKVVASLLVYQALTAQELVGLNESDIDLEKALVNVTGSSKQNGRTLDLKPMQIMLLHKYATQAREKLLVSGSELSTEALIITRYGKRPLSGSVTAMANYGKENQEKLQPLKIRQSVIAHLLKSGNNLRVVQVFAGHKRAASTEAYQQSGLDALKAIIDKIHPLQ